jgi:transposase
VSGQHGSLRHGASLACELRKFGHDVPLMLARDVKAYVKRNKSDAADAEAIQGVLQVIFGGVFCIGG